MKQKIIALLVVLFCTLLGITSYGQSKWSLVRDNDWIKVYESNMDNSSFKRVKVECTVEGNFDKLLQVLNNVGNHKNWI